VVLEDCVVFWMELLFARSCFDIVGWLGVSTGIRTVKYRSSSPEMFLEWGNLCKANLSWFMAGSKMGLINAAAGDKDRIVCAAVRACIRAEMIKLAAADVRNKMLRCGGSVLNVVGAAFSGGGGDGVRASNLPLGDWLAWLIARTVQRRVAGRQLCIEFPASWSTGRHWSWWCVEITSGLVLFFAPAALDRRNTYTIACSQWRLLQRQRQRGRRSCRL